MMLEQEEEVLSVFSHIHLHLGIYCIYLADAFIKKMAYYLSRIQFKHQAISQADSDTSWQNLMHSNLWKNTEALANSTFTLSN